MRPLAREMGDFSGNSNDPLTGLPWATALRVWARNALERGHEVTVACVGVNNLGTVNTALGHVAGGAVLRAASRLLGILVDPATDFLCRSGSDEFAIATVRQGPDAVALTDRVGRSLSLSVKVRGIRHRVTAKVGVAGGRRATASDPSHIAAVADDLLALAHAACTPSEGPQVGARPSPEFAENDTQRFDSRNRPGPRIQLSQVTLREGPHGSTCTVELGFGGRSAVGTASARAHGKRLLFLIAEATLQAISLLVGRETRFSVEDLVEAPFEDQRLVIAVLTQAESGKRVVGSVCTTDLRHGVARAVLHALNRQFSWIGAEGS